MSEINKLKLRPSAISLLKMAGYKKRESNASMYESQVLQAMNDLGHIQTLTRHIDDMKQEGDAYHIATFSLEVEETTVQDFMCHLLFRGYMIESASKYINEIAIKFRKLTVFVAKDIVAESAKLAEIADACYGVYKGWSVDYDGQKRRFAAPDFPERLPVRGIHWHIYREPDTIFHLLSHERLSNIVESDFAPQQDFEYHETAVRQLIYSKLDSNSLEDLMLKLRGKHGHLNMLRFLHFQDSQVEAVREILKNQFYTKDEIDNNFSDIACTADFLGNRLIAIEMGIQAIENGEDFEQFANDRSEALGANLYELCRREMMFRSLSSELKEPKNREQKRKIKI